MKYIEVNKIQSLYEQVIGADFAFGELFVVADLMDEFEIDTQDVWEFINDSGIEFYEYIDDAIENCLEIALRKDNDYCYDFPQFDEFVEFNSKLGQFIIDREGLKDYHESCVDLITDIAERANIILSNYSYTENQGFDVDKYLIIDGITQKSIQQDNNSQLNNEDILLCL